MNPSTQNNDPFPQFYDQYSQEIKNQYFRKPQTKLLTHPFLAMHSDYLHLQVTQHKKVYTKSTFYEGDIILEIRGFVVNQDTLKANLKNIGKNQMVYDGCYGAILWLDLKNKTLLKPRSISEYLIKNSIQAYTKKQNKTKGNCYIVNHFGSKLLVKASQIIPKGEQLIVQQKSLLDIIYK